MALRPARTIRNRAYKQAWTRWSRKNMSKSYVKALPHMDLRQIMNGTGKPEDYSVEYALIAQETFLHRDNAIEAARQSIVKYLEPKIPGKFLLLVRKYPHVVIRENRMLAGAGADRIQKGMRRSFGKPVDRGATVKRNEPIFSLYLASDDPKMAHEALRKAARKLSGSWKVVRIK
ncbi:MAG: 50S ribosomal protein L16 [Candidatus Micrarchaeota archaeon]|nr:50S ribosomal protein L16 [Candidatus Micrarchaeota archaeon]